MTAIDPATLRDLGLDWTPTESGALLARLDHTVSAGGRKRLCAMLANPLTDPATIRSRQEDVKRLRDANVVLHRELGVLIDVSRQYLRSTYLQFPESRFRRWMLSRSYPEMMEQIRRGLTAVGDLSALCSTTLSQLHSCRAHSTAVTEIAGTMEAALAHPEVSALRHAVQQRKTDLARLDLRIRGTYRDELLLMMESIEELDALHSMAIASGAPGFDFPSIESDGPVFDVVDAFHPLVGAPVPTTFSLSPDASVAFVTGPNMSGKTTFLRTCAIIVALAQAGMAVPARRARVSVFDRVFASISVHDNILSAESLFLAEVRRIAMIVSTAQARQRLFVVIDEMFKGTNVADASDATRVVVAGCADYGPGAFLVASHLQHVAEEIAGHNRCRLFCFAAHNDREPFGFDYTIRPGSTSQRLGLAILEREGVLAALRSISSDSFRS